MIGRRGVLLGAPALVLLPRSARADTMMQAGSVQWRYFGDTVMGGVSDGSARMDGTALRLTGTVSTANNGGFIQARTELPDGVPDTASGVQLRVRGNGERYFIHLRTRGTRLPWQYYQAGFETGADWRDVTLTWDDFVPSGGLLPRRVSPARIRSLGLVAYGRDHRADVSLQAFGWVTG